MNVAAGGKGDSRGGRRIAAPEDARGDGASTTIRARGGDGECLCGDLGADALD